MREVWFTELSSDRRFEQTPLKIQAQPNRMEVRMTEMPHSDLPQGTEQTSCAGLQKIARPLATGEVTENGCGYNFSLICQLLEEFPSDGRDQSVSRVGCCVRYRRPTPGRGQGICLRPHAIKLLSHRHGSFPRGLSGQDIKLIVDLNIVPSSRMRGAISHSPKYASMA